MQTHMQEENIWSGVNHFSHEQHCPAKQSKERWGQDKKRMFFICLPKIIKVQYLVFFTHSESNNTLFGKCQFKQKRLTMKMFILNVHFCLLILVYNTVPLLPIFIKRIIISFCYDTCYMNML